MIYFMQPAAGGPIKIGCTDNLQLRHGQLETLYQTPLTILATMEGDRKDERAIHVRFRHLRFGRTEQFKPEPDLMEFIGRPLLAGANPEATEAIDSTRVAIIHLKGTRQYAAWLDEFYQETRIPKATLFRMAMEEIAKKKGFRPPPEM